MDVSRVFPTRGRRYAIRERERERETGRPLSVVGSHKEKDIQKRFAFILYENHHFLERVLTYNCQML